MEPARVSPRAAPGCRSGRRPGAPTRRPPWLGRGERRRPRDRRGVLRPRWQRRRPQRGGRCGLVLRPPTRPPRAPAEQTPGRRESDSSPIAEMVISPPSVGRWDESRITVTFHAAPPEGRPRRAPIDRAIRRVHAAHYCHPPAPPGGVRAPTERVEADAQNAMRAVPRGPGRHRGRRGAPVPVAERSSRSSCPPTRSSDPRITGELSMPHARSGGPPPERPAASRIAAANVNSDDGQRTYLPPASRTLRCHHGVAGFGAILLPVAGYALRAGFAALEAPGAGPACVRSRPELLAS
jgi:hypothetical protein